MAVLTGHVTENHFGLRPMDPMQDLRGIADLIEEAFANDLDHSGQSALQELRWLSRFKPLLWWMVYSSPDHTDFLSGFVWEEEHKIVGNITINRTSVASRRWLISNLAVNKSYRRRGIARGLMYAALELVQEYNGTMVSLQVRADNEPARRLYEELDFQEISGTTHLRASVVPPVDHQPLPRQLLLRPRRFDSKDTRAAYNLATAATPVSVQKEWPIRQSSFRLNANEHVTNMFRRLLGNGPLTHWVIEDGQRFVATVDIKPGAWGKPHHLDLTIHPDWRGLLEEPLISRALNFLWPWASRGLTLKQPTYHPEAIAVYKAFGLTETQTLIWMKRTM